MVIYLRHPIHGEKVASTDVEANHDRENGWVDFDPAAPQVEDGGKDAPKALADTVAADIPSVLPRSEDIPSVLSVTPEVPSFLAPVTTEVPVTPTPEVVSDLPADFPGRESLIAGGLPMWGDLIDKTAEELIALKGIGPATAALILKAMDS